MFHRHSTQGPEQQGWPLHVVEVDSKVLEELPPEVIAWREQVHEPQALQHEFLDYPVGNDFLIVNQ